MTLALHQRAVVFRDALPVAAFGPGVHRLKHVDTQPRFIFDTTDLMLTAPRAVREMLPEGWFTELTVGVHDHAVLFSDGTPVRRLEAGTHRFWTVDPTVHAQVFTIEDPPPTDPRVQALFTRASVLVQIFVGQHQRGLKFVEGRMEAVLEPGRHVFWTTANHPVQVTLVDMRRQLLQISGQELMTRDKVSLRLSLTVEWAPKDAALHTRVALDPKAALHTMAQLALRDHVAGVTLDELLEGRQALASFLESRVIPEAEQIGVQVSRVGLKDVILPGDMKVLLNKVIEAEKEAAANTIQRREQAAHTRAQANAAQLMADRPMLLRLKELEALESIAGQIDELKVVVGAEGLRTLMPKR
jgi:regulator of protease activity HflC (stomatin/prohibitin superfamily)